MSDGPDDIDPGDGGNPEEGPILSPEELEIAEDEHVTQLDEGRFVVSPDARQQQNTPSQPSQNQSRQQTPQQAQKSDSKTATPHSQGDPEAGSKQEQRAVDQQPSVDRESVHRWLRESFANGGSRYGFDVTATFDGSVSQRRMASNDVVTIFESLILWYAQQVDNDTPVEEILGILLMEANVPVRYPPESLKNLVKSTGLGPDDTIADLIAAVDDDGVEL
jgi:hypothetical protein